MTILTIDPGTSLGWALYRDGYTISGVQRFSINRDESPGMRWLRFNSWLKEIRHHCKGVIDIIYHERPHHRGGAATAILEGFISQLQGFAARINAEIKGVHSGTLKKFSAGKGNADKETMLNTAKEKWPDQHVIDDNQADSLHLLSYAMSELGIENGG